MTFVVLSIMLCLKLLDMIELSPFLSSYCFRLIVLKLQKFFFFRSQFEVQIFWQWSSYLQQQATTAGRRVVLLNLDETAIPRCAMKSRGYLTKKSSHVFRFLKKDLQRGIATHVAVVADNTRVQGMMPQFLLVNKRLFKESEVPADLGVPGLKVWQGDSAWNSWLIMRDILQEISFAAQTLENTQLILMLDACPCHLHGGVIGMANALDIWLLFVPARLTYLLQPLDVYGFAAYKTALMRLFRLHEKDGELSRNHWIRSLAALVKEYWRGKKWSKAFEIVGVKNAPQVSLTRELRMLKVDTVVNNPIPRPTADQLQRIFPRNRKCPWHSLMLLPGAVPVGILD